MPHQPDRKRLGWLWLGGFAAALALYVATLAPGLVWQDSGDYQVQAARLSLSRPGDAVRVHPWLIVLAHALGRLGPWDVPHAANLVSAVGTALAVANVLLLIRLLTGATWPAVVGAATFALGHTVWRHAVITETYGWTAAFLSAECLCAWAYVTRGRAGWLLLLFLVNGVAISNHLMAVLSLAVFGIWMLLEVGRGRAPWWLVPAAAGCWLAGGTLYWIVGAMELARTGSVVATLQAMTVGRWGGAIFNVRDLPGLFGRSVLYMGLNYPTPLVLAVPAGVAALACRHAGAPARLILILAAVYFAWAVRYNVPDQYAFFVPFYVCASVMIGVGAWRLRPRLGRGMPAACFALAAMPVLVYAILPAVAQRAGMVLSRHDVPYRDEYRYFLQPWKTGEAGPRQFVDEVFARLPSHALLFADSTVAPPLVYVQKFEKRRPDVVLATQGTQPTYLWPGLAAAYWGDEGADRVAWLRAEGRRAFVVSDQPGYRPAWMDEGWRLAPFGSIYEVVPAERRGRAGGDASRAAGAETRRANPLGRAGSLHLAAGLVRRVVRTGRAEYDAPAAAAGEGAP